MNVNDLEKLRAQKAYKYVIDGKKIIELNTIDDSYYKDDKYKSYVKKIPMMILNNGLGATFAFIYSKRKSYDKNKGKAGEKRNPKNAYDLIYKQIDEWLQESYIKKPKDNDLIEWIIKQDSQTYQAATNEVLALFNWLRRFAEGMIEGDENGD